MAPDEGILFGIEPPSDLFNRFRFRRLYEKGELAAGVLQSSVFLKDNLEEPQRFQAYLHCYCRSLAPHICALFSHALS